MARVAIITPTFNRISELRRAIECVRKQTYRDYIHYIGSDGSTDSTPQFLSSLKDSQIRILLRAENSGAKAFGTGTIVRRELICLGSEQLIAYLDDDNEWLPNHLETLVSAVDSSSSELVWAPMIRLHPNGTQRDIIGKVPRPCLGQIDTSCMMHTRAAHDRVGGWRLSRRWKRADDWSLVFRMLNSKVRFSIASEEATSIYHGRTRPANWSAVAYRRMAPTKYDD